MEVIGEGISFNPDSYFQVVGPLWSNASPGSAFAAQTIRLDLSKYSAVAVFIAEETGNNTSGALFFCRIGDGTTSRALLAYNARQYRSFYAYSNGVTFNGGYNSGSVTGSLSANNSYAIPRYIFGIKGVLPT